jgi:hypothetical protein
MKLRFRICIIITLGLLLASQARSDVWNTLWRVNATGVSDYHPKMKILVQPNAPCIAATVSLADTLVLIGCKDSCQGSPFCLNGWEANAHGQPDPWGWAKQVIFLDATGQDPPALGFTAQYKHAVWSGDSAGYPHLRNYWAFIPSGNAWNNTWPDVRRETNQDVSYHTVTLATSSSWCWVAFVRDSFRGTAMTEKSQVMLYHSTDEGAGWTAADSWQAPNGEVDTFPSVAVSGNYVNLCWLESTDGGAEWNLRYVRSTDGGASWNSALTLAYDVDPGFAPCAAAFGPRAYLSYGDPNPPADSANTMLMYRLYCDACGPLTWARYRVPETVDNRPSSRQPHYTPVRLWTFPLRDSDECIVNGIVVSDIDSTYTPDQPASYRTLVDAGPSDNLQFEGQDTVFRNDYYRDDEPECPVTGLWDNTTLYMHVMFTGDCGDPYFSFYCNALQYSPSSASGGAQSAGLFNPAIRPTLAPTQNPFVGKTQISYSLPRAGNASLRLYDVSGALVLTLARGNTTAGTHNTLLSSEKLSRGIYLLKFESECYTLTNKLIIE